MRLLIATSILLALLTVIAGGQVIFSGDVRPAGDVRAEPDGGSVPAADFSATVDEICPEYFASMAVDLSGGAGEAMSCMANVTEWMAP